MMKAVWTLLLSCGKSTRSKVYFFHKTEVEFKENHTSRITRQTFLAPWYIYIVYCYIKIIVFEYSYDACTYSYIITHPTDGRQKKAVPGLEPKKNSSGAGQYEAPEATTSCRIVCRRRKELWVSPSRMAWLLEFIMLLHYCIVRGTSLLSLAVP